MAFGIPSPLLQRAVELFQAECARRNISLTLNKDKHLKFQKDIG